MLAPEEIQQRAAVAALAARRGEEKPGNLSGDAKRLYETMTEQELLRLTRGEHNDPPE